ncbi:MAG: tetraacyldisaccharide 4'-kinase [Maribacter sp.]|nr:tetraacyldisaccharide 4'-kinase [Maribacter sp.]
MQLLKKLAFPISLIYALVVHIRNFLYDIGLFKSNSFSTPTICVGNLSTGGTGKTPMIEYLVEFLKNKNKVAVLSRGYRRRSKGFVLATSASKVEEIGDEPFQIYSKHPDIVVAVDANRCNGIRNLQHNSNPGIILLDDAFQHRRVKPNFSILLTAYDDLYTNDWYLPTGNLRDSKREAKRANLIVVTKCPAQLNRKKQAEIIKILNPNSHQEVLFSSFSYDQEIKGNASSIALDDLLGRRITLVTGIANPKPLVNYLENKGMEFEHLEYNDHHFFSSSEIELFNSKKFVLTTEKDFVRLKGKVSNLNYISVRHEFLEDGASVLEQAVNGIMH